MDNRIQKHTQQIYRLNDNIISEQKIKASELLTPQRFDLFAKLFYIKNKDKDIKLAKKIYSDHIKAFNPEFKEPGREDKQSIDDFINAFDKLIDSFKYEEFNPTISLIPIDSNKYILDGAHRTAAMIFYNKKVAVAVCQGVTPKCYFDYDYFRKRGLSWKVSDMMAYEMFQWLDNIKCLVAFNISAYELDKIKNKNKIIYEKEIITNHKSIIKLFLKCKINREAIPDKLNKATFFFFQGDDFSEDINSFFIFSPSDQFFESVLLAENINHWNSKKKVDHMVQYIKEFVFRLKNVYYIEFKSLIYRLIHLNE